MKLIDKAADRIAKMASLSPEQVKNIEKQREDYLSQMPDPQDNAAEELTGRLLASLSVQIYNAYLEQLSELYVPIESTAEYDGERFDTARNIRFFNITKWVVDKNENSLEKLVNVYDVLSGEKCNISLVFHRTCESTGVYLAVTNIANDSSNVNVDNYSIRLSEAIRGNFPGSQLSEVGKGMIPCMKEDIPYSVAAASNIPAEKSEKFVSQTIEKLLDGIVPDQRSKEYIIVLLATPVRDIENRKLELAQMYSGLAPYASWTTDYTFNESNAVGDSATVGINVGVSAGVQHGQHQSQAVNNGTTDSVNQGTTDSSSQSESRTDSRSEGTTQSQGTNMAHTEGKGDSSTQNFTHAEGTSESDGHSSGSGNSVGGNIGLGKIGGINANHSWNNSEFETVGHSSNDSIMTGNTQSHNSSDTVGTTQGTAHNTATAVASTAASSIGRSVSQTLGRAVSRSVSMINGISRNVSFGGNLGASFARSSTVTATIGRSEGINQTFINYNIKHSLEILEAQMKRMEVSTALGMWDFAAYVMSEDQNVASNVAHSYLALTQGEESYMTHASVNLWRGDIDEENNYAKQICSYLRELRHPLFGLSPDVIDKRGKYFYVYPPVVTATAGLSGKELAYSLNFPKKSISGLPVIECTEFGRNVVSYDSQPDSPQIRLGRIFHMNREENTEVHLSQQSLASHTFITGSTGSGKSNTIYQILNEIRNRDVHFMVVEPAKGEYKHIFGTDPDVFVYGTNPAVSELLRIDPFSFPKEIHVLEHLDRLIEIFNVCWPMYAAMPAVLKEAVQRAYTECGWDLVTSLNRYGEDIYPSFADVADNIRKIIDSSEYDTENKGAYKGSLMTRLQSLTNGINGMIFTSDEISCSDLFDRNVIVDLSRVGSTETKSLIMGMLVLKLQEHRLASSIGMNEKLKHVTVLEEAHTLLRRSSAEQNMEGSGLLAKSVEMLSNAIAEMRTYGEGFIIADQAPGLLDMSVIRNTNTKIIMRLPDRTDRELVGRSANLNDDQITELAKLPCGVAAVYQNEWVQPVLCKINHFQFSENRFVYTPKQDDEHLDIHAGQISDSLLDCIMDRSLFNPSGHTVMLQLKKKVIHSKLDIQVKKDFMDYIHTETEEEAQAMLGRLIFDFLSAETAVRASEQCNEITDWVHSVVSGLDPSISHYSTRQINRAMLLILSELTDRDEDYNEIMKSYVERVSQQGGIH